MRNEEKYSQLFLLWSAVSKMIVDGARDPEKVTDVLQSIVDGLILQSTDVVSAIRAGRYHLWYYPSRFGEGEPTRHFILQHLTGTGRLWHCATLEQLEAILADKRAHFFQGRAHQVKRIYAWRSVKENRVPCLYLTQDEVTLRWEPLDAVAEVYDATLIIL